MTDPAEDPAPIVINPSTIASQMAAAGRIVTILIAGVGAILQFATARDVVGAYVWIKSTDGAGFIATAVTAGTFAYSMYKTWKNKKRLVILASAAPDSIGQVKGETK